MNKKRTLKKKGLAQTYRIKKDGVLFNITIINRENDSTTATGRTGTGTGGTGTGGTGTGGSANSSSTVNRTGQRGQSYPPYYNRPRN